MSKKSRVIIDTNLWISFLIRNDFIKLDKIIASKHFTLIFSQELLEEFIEVSGRPKFIKYFEQSDLEAIIETITGFSEFVDVTSEIKFLNDSKDDFLLSLAIDGKADYLITGDKELLEVKKYGKTKIISMTEFLLKHEV
ncbi:MAG: putative toxin-antitoxin system toxin component, PIN family [Saprospiraceae bacterium]|nr:putative toxin-antitoxin system toxin component, PIN family [Saprospiraceae bacterium]MBP6695834.1 putative toxin-antitoxin system toxin component, PIN family [Saprospiraceae bacterium]